MPGLDLAEILLVAVLVLLFAGPDRAPEWIRKLGRGYGEIRRRLTPPRNAWEEPRSWEPRPPGRIESWFNAGFDRLAAWFNSLYDRLGL